MQSKEKTCYFTVSPIANVILPLAGHAYFLTRMAVPALNYFLFKPAQRAPRSSPLRPSCPVPAALLSSRRFPERCRGFPIPAGQYAFYRRAHQIDHLRFAANIWQMNVVHAFVTGVDSAISQRELLMVSTSASLSAMSY